MSENVLIGRTIADVFLASDQKAIRFVLDDGEEIIARADGDCCSATWIESLDAPDVLRGGTVRAVEDLYLREEAVEYGAIQHYGCKITTERGACVIDYRNESNGYYGGDLSWPGDYFYGGVYGQNVSSEEWYPVTP